MNKAFTKKTTMRKAVRETDFGAVTVAEQVSTMVPNFASTHLEPGQLLVGECLPQTLHSTLQAAERRSPNEEKL